MFSLPLSDNTSKYQYAMSGLFSTRTKYIDQLLLLVLDKQRVEYISRALIEFLAFDVSTPPTSPEELLEPAVWQDLQTHPQEPLPHAGVLACRRADGSTVSCNVIHYVFVEERHLLLFAPYKIKSEGRSDLRELFDFVNHETRTPINALLGMIELLGQTRLSDEQRQYIDAMRGLADSLINLLSDALDSSRISAGKMELKQDVFDLYNVIAKIVERNKLLHPDLVLSFTYSEAIPHQIYGDAHRIEQVIINVISNALKHTAKGSVDVLVMPAQRENSLEIKVVDTGCGISSEVQKRLFAPYERSAGNMTMGSGLGLYISKQIVELHKGTIALESVLNQGTTVTIVLPLIQKEAIINTQTPAERPEYAPYQGARLLLVDDNAINVMVVQKFMNRWGYNSDVANSGAQALEAIDKNEYGLVLMDIRMPVMDGFQATEQIRARKDARAQVPIIALTASTEPGVRERIEAVQMNGYLFKPFNAEELHQTVAKYLGWSDEVKNE